jgi:hypothetical protein
MTTLGARISPESDAYRMRSESCKTKRHNRESLSLSVVVVANRAQDVVYVCV